MKYYVVKPQDYKKLYLPGLSEWTKALRSGEYEQGKEQLYYRGCYCCLGVLSKIQGRLGVLNGEGYDGEMQETLTLAEDNPVYKAVGAAGFIPEGVHVIRHELDLSYEDMLDDEKTEWLNEIVDINDKGFTFNEIADILEELYTDKP